MKITLNKNNFEIVLSNFQSFLDKKDSSQITSHIYLETLDNKLLLKATDYEISIQSKIDIIQKIARWCSHNLMEKDTLHHQATR